MWKWKQRIKAKVNSSHCGKYVKSIERINSEIFKTNFKGIGNYRQYPVGREPHIHCCPSVFLAPIHSTHHTTTVLYVIPSPHTCISTLLLWQFCTAFTYGISSCQYSSPSTLSIMVTSIIPSNSCWFLVHVYRQDIIRWQYLRLILFIIFPSLQDYDVKANQLVVFNKIKLMW